MIIENPAAFKSWLASILEPLCDADPVALAKYIYALVRKDRPVGDIRNCMNEQLDVFLQKQTKSFVSLLFKTIDNHEYLNFGKQADDVKREDDVSSTLETKPVPGQIQSDIVTEGIKCDEESEDVKAPKEEKKTVDDRVKSSKRKFRKTSSSGRGRSSERSEYRSRSRDRDLEKYKVKMRNRSPPKRYRSRSRSNSPRVPTVSPHHYPRLRRSPEQFRSRSRSYERRQSPNNRRCLDFDEKGFCMRGDLCIYDHGVDPVVLEDVNFSHVLSFGQTPQPAASILPPPPIICPESMSLPPFPSMIPGPPVVRPPLEYNPDTPSLNWNRPYHGRNRRNFAMYKPHQRELINIPVEGRVNPNVENKQPAPTNCSLVLKKIPAYLNSISNLSNHFTKFGNIVNIQINFGNNPQSALISFSSHAEAKAAYHSTEAVLNNRFIEVFWLYDKNVKQQVKPTKQKESVVRMTPEKDKKPSTPQNPKPDIPIKSHIEMKRKSIVRLANDIRQKSQVLLEKQIMQQKMLIKKLENPKLDERRKEKIIKTIKILEESCKKLENNLRENIFHHIKKTKEEVEKEILDTELDIITKQQEGSDITKLQQRLLVLKAEVKKEPKSEYRATNFKFVRSKNAPNLSLIKTERKTNVPSKSGDCRKVEVSGYEIDEKESLIELFKKFGKITNISYDESVPSVVFEFENRKSAEEAMMKGKLFGDRLLTLNMVDEKRVIRLGVLEELNTQSFDNSDYCRTTTSELSLHEDDEEGEDKEDRSWRR